MDSRTPTLLLLLSLVAACGEDPGPSPAPGAGAGGDDAGDSAAPWVPPGCGDGELDADEECDDGEANSDTAADACRTTCLLPWCGDGVVDAGEECDDANAFGGDGCAPGCVAQSGQPEVEPNDEPSAATPWTGGTAQGGLPEGDRDCWSVSLGSCESLSAAITAGCERPLALSLHDADGRVVATGSPGEDGCAVLDPERASGARFLAEGDDWALCVTPLADGPVPAYDLDISLVAAEDADYPLSADDDLDGDSIPRTCDDDDDGDGVLDEDDNCPDVPNGPDPVILAPTSGGFLRTWLAAAPLTDGASPNRCLPTGDALVDGVSDADVLPALGDPASSTAWHILASTTNRINFVPDYGTVGAPRESYTALYVRGPSGTEATLGMGLDDGARVWFGGEVVSEVNSCQGVNNDQFTAPVEFTGDWQLLMLKVYDQGGGWGQVVRFLDGDGEPITDLELSLASDGAFISNQTDTDGDGIGDACDDDPAG